MVFKTGDRIFKTNTLVPQELIGKPKGREQVSRESSMWKGSRSGGRRTRTVTVKSPAKSNACGWSKTKCSFPSN